MPTQTESGKAFEYALINESANILTARGFNINVVADATYNIALVCYSIFNGRQQSRYSRAAIAAINHIITLEPRLVNPTIQADILTLQLMPDAVGIAGDVRDLLFVRSTQKWEIGISAKNNHSALKHSRLSNIKDFGTSWVGVPCSPAYFAAIAPIFAQLVVLRGAGALWRTLPNKHSTYYAPILDAFRDELSRIAANNPKIPQALLTYLIGSNDFYKVMKRSRIVEVAAFNINGTLGKKGGIVAPVARIPKLPLPTQIIQFQMANGRTDTLSMICDNGWQLSFRIHSATSLVEASLKFDINLTGHPPAMYSHHMPY